MLRCNYLLFCLFFIVTFSAIGSFSIATEEVGYWIPRDPPPSLYTIDAKIDLESETISGEGTVEFTNVSVKQIAVVAFRILRPTELNISHDSSELQLIHKDGNILYFKLPQPLQPKSSVQLIIEFTLTGAKPDKSGVYVSGFWMPTLWWGGIRHVNDYKISIAPPSGYALAITGRKNENDGYYYSTGVRECGIYLGKSMLSESVDIDNVRITALFTEAGAEGGRYCLNSAADAVAYYREWLGFYPFDYLYVLPGGSGVWGGYPLATGMVRIHGEERFHTAPALHWRWITAHEIGHQYWGEYVLDGDDPRWLWIGLGIYADREYTLARGIGADKQFELMSDFPAALMKNYDTTIDVVPEKEQKIKFDFNGMVIHGKGFSFISALDLTIGRETFQKAYKRILSEYGGKRLGWRDFQTICEQESGENLQWFFGQWVRSNKYLRYKVTSRSSVQQADKWISEITVKRLGTLSMPIPVRAVFEDGTSQTKFTDRTRKVDILVFESDSRLWQEIIDPENRLAMLSKALPLPEGAVAELIQRLPWTGAGEEGLRVYQAAMKNPTEDQASWFKLGLVLFDGDYYKESYNTFAKLTALKADGLYGFAAYTWMGQLQDLLGNREKAIEHYQQALNVDQDFSMQHSQYGLVLDKSWIEKLLKEPFKW